MSHTVEHEHAQRDGSRNGWVGTVSFSDVARAHHAWDQHSPDLGGTARETFEQALEAFERQSRSTVVEAYWCRKQASAVALAKVEVAPGRATRWFRRIVQRGEVPDFRLHRETDWVTGEFQELADLLHDCDVLAVKALYGLEGFQRALVMQWLLKVEAHILGYIEWRQVVDARGWRPARRNGRPAMPRPPLARRKPGRLAGAVRREKERRRRAAAEQLERFSLQVRRELSKIEDYYLQAGHKRARLRFVGGMLTLGLLGVLAAAVASGLVLWLFGLLHFHDPGVRRFYASMSAGAVGAVISVLIRMSGKRGGFTIDHELGSVGVRRLGAFRPLIGAVSGVVVSLLIQTTLVPIEKDKLSIELYVVVAFLAGFSERWTKVVLDGAMRTIAKVEDGEEEKQQQSSTPASPAASG